MTDTIRTTKTTAKAALKDIWGPAIALTLVVLVAFMAVSILQSIVATILDITFLAEGTTEGELLNTGINSSSIAGIFTSFFTFLEFMVLGCLGYAYSCYFYYRSYGADPAVGTVFKYFGSFATAIKCTALFFRIYMSKLLIFIFCSLPAVGIYYFTSLAYTNSMTQAEEVAIIMLLILSALCGILGAVVATVINGRYFAVPYVLAHNPTLPTGRIIAYSVKAAKNSLSHIFYLHLAYLPHYLSLLLGIPFLYSVPQISMGKAIFARYLMESNGVVSPNAFPIEFGIPDPPVPEPATTPLHTVPGQMVADLPNAQTP